MDFQNRENMDTAPIGSGADASAQQADESTKVTNLPPEFMRQEQPVRTPYQTPVRAEAGMPQYRSAYTQDTQQPFETGTQAYSTYQEWEAENSRRGRRKKEKKPRSRKPLIAVVAVILAVAVFAGGMGVGGLIAASKQQSAASSQQVQKPQVNGDLPSLGISSTPSSSEKPAAGAILNGEQIYEKCVPSMVAIQSGWLGLGSSGSGSGVIMTSDGYIITNAHVVLDESTSAPADKVTVVLHDGSNLPASIIGTDENTDLAVLKVTPDSPLAAAEFGDSDALKPGQNCYAIGSPSGLQLANTITTGSISAISRDITINDNVMSLIQTDAAINPGNSGGALINQYGQVVGITSAKLGISYYESLGFAIPITTAKEIVDELIQNGYVAGRPQIGISGYNIDEATAEYYNVPQGVMIDSIDSRSNAAAAGMKSNDIIIGLNGEDIKTMDEINAVKETMKAGETLTLTVHRLSTGEEMDFTFALNDEHDLKGDDPAQARNDDSANNSQNGYDNYENGYYFNPFDYFFR
ncbi:MAG: trypsin-like peptidase domain-containing protein [Butyricicoccus sp.]|nr:trypsin-like peptidase domain-containing protein [Butyricicoccus sp.]